MRSDVEIPEQNRRADVVFALPMMMWAMLMSKQSQWLVAPCYL